MLPGLNKHLEKGYPLPVVEDLSFVNPAITFQDGYITIATDVHYDGDDTTATKAMLNATKAETKQFPVVY